jgi:hypothetical protein
MKRITLLLVLIAGAQLLGCKGFDSPINAPWINDSEKDGSDSKNSKDDDSDLSWSFGLPKEKKLDEPVKMFVTWTDSVYTQLGKPPTRGFAARIYFYNKNYEAIEVDGSLVVFGYDDSSRDDANRKADKKFVFTPEHLAGRFSNTQIGASYSVWVPWDEVGGPKKSISLLPVFRSEEGHIVRGEQIVSILRGKATGKNGEQFVRDQRTDAKDGQQVAFNSPVDSATKGEAKDAMKTTTIRVPQSTIRYLQAPVAIANQRGGFERPPATNHAVQAPIIRDQSSSHYIFDNQRSPIQPRGYRRYASEGIDIREHEPRAANSAAVIPPAPPRSIRSEPRIPQAPTRPPAPLGRGPAQWQQYRATPPSVPPQTQRSYPQLQPGGYSSGGQTVVN